MSIVIRVAIVVLSAYAGSALASVQFADLPEPLSDAAEIANTKKPTPRIEQQQPRIIQGLIVWFPIAKFLLGLTTSPRPFMTVHAPSQFRKG